MSEADNRLPHSGDFEPDLHRRVELAAEVFSKYNDDIRAMIGFHVKDKSRADDLFQNLFISIVREPIPSHVTEVRSYLYRIIVNDVYDTYRSTKFYQENVEKYAEIRKHGDVQKYPQDNMLEAEETRQMLEFLERQLPKHQAMVVTHFYQNGLNADSTARQLNLSKRSVHRYLTAAKRKMRDLIPNLREILNDLP